MTDNNTQRAIVATVDLGFKEIEGLMLPDGSYAVGIPQLAEIFGINKNCANQTFKHLLGSNAGFITVTIELSDQVVDAISTKLLAKVISSLARDGNEKAILIFNDLVESPDWQIPLPDPKTPEPSIKRSASPGFIYVFEGSAQIKVGFSKNPESRIKQLQRWDGELQMIAKVKGTQSKEQKIHRLLRTSGDCMGDEWYPLSRKTEILNLLKNKEK